MHEAGEGEATECARVSRRCARGKRESGNGYLIADKCSPYSLKPSAAPIELSKCWTIYQIVVIQE
jgi:hypothetical protein